MKKRSLSRKLNLNRKTVVNLNVDEMRRSRAGGDKTELGVSCDTGNPCCNTTPPRCTIPAQAARNKSMGIHDCTV
ncbi:class I lanthipeptide [Acidobacteriota bacterium]